jgi:hypothetical protein
MQPFKSPLDPKVWYHPSETVVLPAEVGRLETLCDCTTMLDPWPVFVDTATRKVHDCAEYARQAGLA